jgi:hypothetical protein
MSDLSALPPAVRSYVQGYVARGRRLALVRRAGFALTVLLFWAILCCGVDRLIQLPAALRLAALLAGATAVIAIMTGPLRRWLGEQPDWIAVAQEIERQNPRFDQRLVTVMSRLLGRPEHRGSDEILEHLVYQVDREVSEQRSATLLPLRSAAAPWLALLLTLAVAAGLCFVPGLRLPQLGARFAVPWAAIGPVTTANLTVFPGDLDVPQSNSLQIDAEALRIEGSQVWLSVSDDGTTWSRSAMSATSVGASGDGRYSFTLASVDRDLQYYVSGGDARSPRYTVRVLRRPAVSEFNIRYTYPAYTGKPPMSVSNTDGVIEAPVGTEALVTVTATEPLQLALFTAPGGDKALFSRAGADNVRQGRVSVQRDGRYQLDLVSTREVTGGGPATMEIRAQPDRPPVVRLAEAGATLRLNPRDILPLSYDVMDDYGIDTVTVRAQGGSAAAFDQTVDPDATDVNGGGAPTAGPAVPAQRVEPSRRVSGEFDLDLANLPLTIGDVLTVVVSAKDTGGQTTSAAPVQVLLSPRSIGPEAYDRMADLADASRLADALADELAAALKSAEAAPADVAGASASAAMTRRDRHVSAAVESAAMARRAMLRAVAHGAPPPLCVAIAAWVDSAQTVSWRLSELLRSEETGGAAQWAASLDVIRRTAQLGREIQSNLKTISQGERAAAILADRDSLASAESRPAPADGRGERLKQTLQRMREEIAVAAAELGLDASASDFEPQLRSKVAVAASVVASQHVVDFSAVAREWAGQAPSTGSTGSTSSPQAGSPQASQHRSSTPGPPDPGLGALSLRPPRERHGELSERLLVAAEAEAVRRDADLVRARDLQLASRAAAMLTAEPASKINELAAALSALMQDHDLNRRPHSTSSGQARGPDHPEDAPVREAAARAREQLARWAGEGPALASTRSNSPGTMPAIALARAEKAESLALLAGAESAGRRYGDVAEADRALRQAVERLLSPSTGSGSEASLERSDAQLAQQARLAQTSQEVARSMKTAKDLDGFSDGQQKLAEETRGAKDEAAAALAEKQRGLADQISQLTPVKPAAQAGAATGAAGGPSGTASDDPNWRDRAIATILSAQVQLSAMPQQLSEALTAADDWRRAADRAKAARRDADAAPAEHKAAAARAAELADEDSTEAARRLESAAAPLALSAGDALGKSLEPFAPEATASRAAIADALLPAMKALAAAIHSEDPGAAAGPAGVLRQAIDAAQVELARARDEVAQRDPLVAAKWFARAAADALGRKPPDFPMALHDQDLTQTALARAWDASVHRAASLRLAELPAMHALYAPEPLTGDGSRLAGGARPTGGGVNATPGTGTSATASISRNWRHLAPRDGDNAAATPHQADPAGYEAALKAYFEALGNVGGNAEK